MAEQNPYAAFYGEVGKGVAKGIGNATADPSNTNTATSASYGAQLGGTGWNINFGSGNIASDATNKQVSEQPPSTLNGLGTWSTGAGGDWWPVVAVVGLVGLAVAYRMTRKGRR